MSRNKLNLKTKLILIFLLVSLIPLSIVIYLTTSRIKSQTDLLIKEKLSLYLEEKQKFLNEWFLSRKSVIFLLSQTRDVYQSLNLYYKSGAGSKVWRQRKGYLKDLAENIKKNYNATFVLLADRYGRVIYSTGSAIKSIKSSDYFTRAINGEINFSAVYYDKYVKAKVISLASPVFSKGKSGETTGVFVIGFKLNTIRKFLLKGLESIGETTDAYVIDESGRLITTPRYSGNIDTSRLILRRNETAGLIEAIRNNIFGYLSYKFYKDFRGKDVIGNHAIIRVGDRPYGLIVSVEEDEVYRGYNKLRNTLWRIIGVIIAGVIITGFYTGTTIAKPIRMVVTKLRESASMASTAIEQIAASASRVAQSSSSQAAAIEETSASVNEIYGGAKSNAESSVKGSEKMKEFQRTVTDAGNKMKELGEAMKNIAEASEKTNSIIKIIDEIAFQTNLLALNAAVEAARAGEAGAGFAVVADEVRNLAQRTAESAKNTQALIEDILEKIHRGVERVEKVNKSFEEIVIGSTEINDILQQITTASQEQKMGIENINKAISQLDKLLQENSSVSEELASATEEIDAEIKSLYEIVEELNILITGASQKLVVKEPFTSGEPFAQPPSLESGREHLPVSPSDKEVKPGEVINIDEEEFKEFE